MNNGWTARPWGRFRVDSSTRGRIECIAEFDKLCSSVHIHRHMDNRFVVEEGKIVVAEWMGPFMASIELTAGMSHTVARMVPHFFIVMSPGRMREIYTGEHADLNDIQRFTASGIRPDTTN